MSLRPLLLAAIAGLFAANASAAVLFSTLGQGVNTTGILNDADIRFASDFETAGSGATITGLTLNLSNGDTIAHNFKTSIFSDLGGTVGALLTDFSTEVIAANQVGAINKLFTHAGYSLAANTKYWVVIEMLEDIVDNTFDVTWTGNTADGIDAGGSFLEVTSSNTQVSFDAGGSWGDFQPGNFLFNVIGTTVVPEPSRAVLAIAGLFGLCFRRRR
jgi:hypothetical protein